MEKLYRQFHMKTISAAMVFMTLTFILPTASGQDILDGIVRIKVSETLASELEQKTISTTSSGSDRLRRGSAVTVARTWTSAGTATSVNATGLALTASTLWLRGGFYEFLSILHAITVIAALLFLPFGKFFHIFQRPAQLGASFYKDAGAAGEHERQHAHHEGQRGHQDRTQPQPARLDGRLHRRAARELELARELDDQDGVLRRQADQHDETHLAVDVIGEPARPLGGQRAEDGERHPEQDDERQDEALVLGRQRQVDEQQRQAEDQERLPAGLGFLQ